MLLMLMLNLASMYYYYYCLVLMSMSMMRDGIFLKAGSVGFGLDVCSTYALSIYMYILLQLQLLCSNITARTILYIYLIINIKTNPQNTANNMTQTTIFLILCLSALIMCTNSLFSRDIALQYLKLDKDNDYLLSKQQLQQFISTKQQLNKPYYNMKAFRQQVYPVNLFTKFDIDQNGHISKQQLQNMAKQTWRKYSDLHSSTNILKYLNDESYMQSCDKDKNGKLDKQEIVTCVNAVLMLEQQNYANRVQSLLYANKNIGYDREEFLKLMKNFKNVQGATLQQYVNKLFQLFQWNSSKIQQDNDQLIGPEQGRIMQPIFIMMMLDKNADGQLDRKQMLFFTSKAGGQKIFQIVDVDHSNKVDKNQFVSYHYFASCVDCGNGNKSESESKKVKSKEGQQL